MHDVENKDELGDDVSLVPSRDVTVIGINPGGCHGLLDF